MTLLDQPDFLREDGVWPQPGDMQTEAPEREDKEELDPDQTVEDDSKGEETYTDPKPPPAVEQFVIMLAKAFKPQPIGKTPEDDAAFMPDESIASQVKDFLRYIATTSIKVQPVPNDKFKVWTQVVTDSEARPIAGYQPGRKRLVIRTRGAATEHVYIADEQGNATPANGFTLEGGLTEGADRIELGSTREVWAIASDGDTVTLELMGEYY